MDIINANTLFNAGQIGELQRLVPQIMWATRAMVSLTNIEKGKAAIPLGGGGGGGVWGTISGVLSNQTDLQNALDALTNSVNLRQLTLVAGTNIKTLNGVSILGSGDLVIGGGGGGAWGSITGTLSAQTDLSNALALKAPLISPAFTTPNLGTPTAGNLSNCTQYPVAALSGLGANVAAWLATPSSANLAAAVTGETGTSGGLVFSQGPTIDSLVATGIIAHGAELVVPSAIVGTAVDFSKGEETLFLSGGGITLTASGSPATGQRKSLVITGDTVNRTVTWFANVRSNTQQAVIASHVQPANVKSTLLLVKTAAGYDLFGEPEPIRNISYNRSQATGANEVRTLAIYVASPGTIISVYGKTSSGTISVQVRINGVNVTTGVIAVTSTRGSVTPSAANILAAGDVLDLSYGSNAAAVATDISVIVTPASL